MSLRLALFYIVSSRTARATQLDPAHKNKQTNKQKEPKDKNEFSLKSNVDH